MQYEVGQVIYLLNDKTLKVIPAQICEEVVRNTLAGKEITYLIQMPDKKRTQANLADVQTQIFTDSNTLKSYMVNNAKKMITKLLDDAYRLEKVFTIKEKHETEMYIETLTNSSHEIGAPTNSVQKDKNDDKIIKVDIGNGMKARVKVEDLTNLKF